jgi:hypothetical protein
MSLIKIYMRAHKRQLEAIADFFEHALALPPAFHALPCAAYQLGMRLPQGLLQYMRRSPVGPAATYGRV